MNRTVNSVKNVKVGFIGQILQSLCQFACRTVFVYSLSQEYLGVNGLFSNILSILSLAELGFGSALTYSLYKPLAEEDDDQVRKLMNLYRKIYIIIAGVVLAFGLILVPFLDFFVKDAGSVENLRILYFLYLLNSVLSYLLIYKKSIIDADQKKYISVIYQKGFSLVQNILQIVFLLLTRNYIVYLVIQIACGLICNICISVKADKLFPYLKKRTRDLPDIKTTRDIAKNTAAMSIHRLGNVVVNNTDNLILSSFVSLSSVGVYSNYLLIISNLNMFTNVIFDSFTASIGNLHVLEGGEKLNEIFEQMMMLGGLIYGYVSVCLFSLFNPFIILWIGKDYTFNSNIVFCLVMIFYLNGMRNVIRAFRDALGLFWYDRYKPIFESLINLVFSLLLVVRIGILGVFLGTIISNLSICFWVEPYVLYKYGLNANLSKYFKMYIKSVLTIFMAGFISILTLRMLHIDSILAFILGGMVVSIIYIAVVIIAFSRNENFNKLVKRVTKKDRD